MKKTLFAFLSGLFAVVGMMSCNTDNNNTTVPAASFGIVNASAAAGTIDVYFGGSPLIYGLQYGADTGYFTTQPGIYSFAVDTAGSSTARYSTNLSFTPGVTSSVFVIDSVNSLQTVVVADSVNIPSDDSAVARFFDFSPNAPALDFVVNGNVMFTNRTFNDEVSNPSLNQFMYLAPGNYTIQLRAAGTSTVLYSTMITVTGGKVYTFYAKGYMGGTDAEALSVGTLIHNE